MSKTQTSLRLDADTLQEAKAILAHLGLNFSEAVNIFTNMIVVNHGLPFEVKIPNKKTAKILKEVRESKNIEPFSLDELKELGDEKTSTTSQGVSKR